MSLVVYYGQELACDSACWQGDLIVGHRRKIGIVGGYAYGITGDLLCDRAFRGWLKGFDPTVRTSTFDPRSEDSAGFSAIWIKRSTGVVYEMNKCGQWCSVGKQMAWTIGAEVAQAVALGVIEAPPFTSSAKDAVRAAIRLTRHAAGNVYSLTV